MKIYSQSPSRISLLGGGTDLPVYADNYGGCVINMAINIRQRFLLNTDKGVNSFPYGADPSFVYKILNEYRIKFNSIISEYDGIIESGLGSSASCAVALIGAIYKFKGLPIDKKVIAEEAWDIEVNKLGLYGGKQDQYASAFGGINKIEFPSGKVTPIKISDDVLKSMCLFYTGKNRKSATIQEGFRNLTKKQIGVLGYIKSYAQDFEFTDYIDLGTRLDEVWQLKKESNKGVSNSDIDSLYEKAIKLGALGGKVLGAGGGGFILFIVDPDKKDYFIKNMPITHWDFGIDYNGLEVRVLPDYSSGVAPTTSSTSPSASVCGTSSFTSSTIGSSAILHHP